jgi:hypothetical protein
LFLDALMCRRIRLAAPWTPSIVVHLVASTCQNGIGRRDCKHAIGEARTVLHMSWGCVGIPCNRRAPMHMCVCVCDCQSIAVNVAPGKQSWQPQRCGGRGDTGRGDVFLLHCRLFWLRPGLLPFLFILWRVHVKMALGDVIASMPLVKQGLFVVCRGGALASLAYSLCVRSKQFRRQ